MSYRQSVSQCGFYLGCTSSVYIWFPQRRAVRQNVGMSYSPHSDAAIYSHTFPWLAYSGCLMLTCLVGLSSQVLQSEYHICTLLKSRHRIKVYQKLGLPAKDGTPIPEWFIYLSSLPIVGNKAVTNVFCSTWQYNYHLILFVKKLSNTVIKILGFVLQPL